MDGRAISVDVLAIVRNWILAAGTQITDHFGNPPRVGAKLDPTQDAVLPAARLTRITGTTVVPSWLTAPVVEVDVWADDEPTAFDAAAALEGRMHDRAIIGTHAGIGVVTNVETAQGLRYLADEDLPELDRFVFGVRYHAHPLPAE
jgi:hypothetical protein